MKSKKWKTWGKIVSIVAEIPIVNYLSLLAESLGDNFTRIKYTIFMEVRLNRIKQIALESEQKYYWKRECQGNSMTGKGQVVSIERKLSQVSRIVRRTTNKTDD